MANEIRVRTNFIGGLVEDNPLSNVATTLTSAGLAALPVIGSTQHQAIILDPDGVNGASEIAYITVHTAAGGTATILRAQEGTTARQHDRDVTWVHSATVKEFDGSGGGSGLIGLNTYTPASDGATFTSSTSYADVDATNMVVTFTTPPSGKVRVVLQATTYSSGGTNVYWALREGAANVGGGKQAGSASSCVVAAHLIFVVTGLTPGSVHTYKWGWKSDAASNMYLGPTDRGSAVMEVWAVNL